MRNLWINLRGGIRILIRSPAFAITAILILGLGIGINTLVFNISDAILLRPLPYPDPNQLVWISQGVSANKTEYALAPDFNVWRSQVRSFSQAVAFSERFRTVVVRDEPEVTLSTEVSSEFLPLLGIQPVAGRGFLSTDDQPGGDRVAILSHGFCLKRFGMAQGCVGETIRLDGEPFEVIGVLPDHFRFPEPLDTDVITPLALSPDQVSRVASMSKGIRQLKVIARLRPDVTLLQAQTELNAVQQRIVQEYPQFQDGREARIRPLREHLIAGISQAALVLSGAVGFLWVLGCLNVGSLLLARTISRRTEMAVRMSIGASRLHLFMQVLVENAVLTLLGCILSFFISFWGHSYILSILPQKVFGSADIQFNARSLALVITSFMLTVLLVSVISAWALPSQNIADFLKSSGTSVIGSLKLRRMLNVIVVGELALAVVLLVAAGLMIKSFWALRYRSLGFQPQQLLTLRLDLTPSRYPEKDQQSAFFENLMQRVATLPGVDAVAVCSSAPPAPIDTMFRLTVQGQPASDLAMASMVRVQAVNSDYFRVLRIPLVEGQMFSDREQMGGYPVVVVNRILAQEYVSDGHAVGKKIRLGGDKAPWVTIIGVVEDFKNVGLADAPESEVYYPYQQFPFLRSMYLLVRLGTVEPLSLTAPVRREVWKLDREQQIADVQTLEQRLTASVTQPRFVMSLLMVFAVLALLLAATGVYGIMSYASRQRTREIAIRMALGAQQREIIWMMVREGLVLSLLGASIGIVSARAASQLLSSMLHGVAPSDPYTFVIVSILLIIPAICGCYLVARRAIKIDPLEVLRHE